MSTPRKRVVVVEDRDPAGVVQQHLAERVLQRRVRAHPRVEPAHTISDCPLAERTGSGQVAAEVSHVVDDDRVLLAGRIETGSRLLEGDVGSQDRRLLELAQVDARDLQPLQASVRADEVRHEVRRRSAQHDCGRVVLREQPAFGHDRDAVADLHGFFDVVRDEHDRLLHLDLQPQELVLQAVARDGVDRAERLVHEQHGRVGAECTSDADALLLSARQLTRVAISVHGRVEADEIEQLVDARLHLRLLPTEQPRHRRRCSCRSSDEGRGRRSG